MCEQLRTQDTMKRQQGSNRCNNRHNKGVCRTQRVENETYLATGAEELLFNEESGSTDDDTLGNIFNHNSVIHVSESLHFAITLYRWKGWKKNRMSTKGLSNEYNHTHTIWIPVSLNWYKMNKGESGKE